MNHSADLFRQMVRQLVAEATPRQVIFVEGLGRRAFIVWPLWQGDHPYAELL